MSGYLPRVEKQALQDALASPDSEQLYELLCTPLHEALYAKQNFDFVDVLSMGQQLLLSYDYLRHHAMQGGFIQFLANGYVSLLPDMPEWLETIGAPEMAQLLDDVLKVFVLNVNLFDREIGPKEFAELYDELKEFEILDARFEKLNAPTVEIMLSYARQHLHEFVEIV